jgi:hypothetical protein
MHTLTLTRELPLARPWGFAEAPPVTSWNGNRDAISNGAQYRPRCVSEIRFTTDNTDIPDQKMQNNKCRSLRCSFRTSVV